MTVDTVTVLSVAVLRDEFEFGKKRCQRYIDRMNLKAECLTEGFVKWNEIVEDIDNDMGIRLRIRRNDRRYGTTL